MVLDDNLASLLSTGINFSIIALATESIKTGIRTAAAAAAGV